MTDLVESATVDLAELVGEWRAECDELVADLSPASGSVLALPTPAKGWDVGMQLAHLAHGDELASLAVTSPDEFAAHVQDLLTGDVEAAVDNEMQRYRQLSRGHLVEAWREQSQRLSEALSTTTASDRVTWITGPMSAASFVRARLMEAVAHGQDVRDALGAPPRDTARLRHVAYLGVRTRAFSYAIRGYEPPASPVHVRLRSGEDTWTWGPEDADERIVGPALDFCLVVTRRRHPADTRLEVTGAAAAEWMDLAQCYAGPASPHRPAGSFRPLVPSVDEEPSCVVASSPSSPRP